MRIWILTSELPPLSGGIATYAENFARLLGAAGHDVVVLARSDEALDTMLAPGVRLLGHGPGALAGDDAGLAECYRVLGHFPGLSYELAERALRLARDQGPPDIIESQEYGALPYYLLQRKLTERTPVTDTPILVHLHGPVFEILRVNQEPRFRFPNYWIGQLEKFCIVAADALLSPSAFLAAEVSRALGRSLEVAQIPYPLSVSEVGAERSAERGEIVYAGRLEVRKGVLPLVEACSRLWGTGEQFRLTLIGRDVDFLPRNTTVGRFIQERHGKWIAAGQLRLVGQMERAAVLDRLQRAWAVVVPSLWDNFPNACMEAMGLGQLVLASRAGGQAEMIGEENRAGVLFDWSRAGDFEEKLRSVLGLSGGKRASIGRAARARISELCRPETVVDQRIRHYEATIARRSPRAFFPTINSTVAWRSNSSGAQDGEQPGLLSVVVPFHDLGQYLDDTLRSILAVTDTPLEVVIVDDGTTDEASLEVLRAIDRRQLPNVRVLHTENRGLAAARNAGADAARGEFLTFVDADDLVGEDYYRRAVAVLRRYPNVAFVYSWLRYFGAGSGIWPSWNTEFPYLLGHNMLAAFLVIRRAAFQRWARNKPEMAYSLEDFEAWVSLVRAGGVGVSLPFPLVKYRIRPGSMYRSAHPNQLLYLYDLVTTQHAEAYREWGPELVNLLNANGPAWAWNNPALEPDHQRTLGESLQRVAAQLGIVAARLEQGSHAEQAHLAAVQACRNELLVLGHPGAEAAPLDSGMSLYDAELGGRLITRFRESWVGRQLTRNRRLRWAVRRALRV